MHTYKSLAAIILRGLLVVIVKFRSVMSAGRVLYKVCVCVERGGGGRAKTMFLPLSPTLFSKHLE